ncbi:DUF551 domain-containing protein [Klebsiella aerogenes]|nr:DUF551 domain-containing protein [Klebsiella aerogenes]
MNQLTKEWLQQTIAELESVRDEIPFGIDTNSELELAAFRLALAAIDSSESVELPLDYLQGHKDGLEWASQLAEANHPEAGDWLYNDPIELAKAIRKGPDMPPAQPAPVVPGKWIPVSERMPDENAGRQVLACFKGGDISTLYYFEGRWDDAYGIVPIRQDVTHWMQLPAAPQEVKGE